MKRRNLLAGAAAAAAMPLAMPQLRAAERPRVLRFVPNVDVPVLDPVANTAAQVRNHAFLVWDTLFGIDENYAPQPQMLESATVDADGRVWTLTLRPGLKFHDGTPVLARDCAASIRRWAAIDGFGMTLLGRTDELSAPDDRTIRFRLNSPFPLLPDALGHMSPNIPAIMPARIAEATPATLPVKEIVGSGPFRFLAAERVPGALMAYERFADYVPRADGKPGFTSGPKIVNVDRVEWHIMPEPASAVAALQRGEIDWYEAPPPDLLPLLRKQGGITVETIDTTGVVPILRFNTLYPPFDNVAIRRAVLAASQQKEFLSAFSDDDRNWRTGFAAFCPGTPMDSNAGVADSLGTMSTEDAKRAIIAAGYKGERVVLLDPTDHPVNSVMAQVGADLLKRLGFTVDDQAMDAATMFQRRGNRGPLDKGGWSIFPSAVAGIDVLNPAVSFLTRGNGKNAWYGWPEDAALEALRASWFEAPDVPAQRAIAENMQRQVLQDATYVPLGLILQPTAFRNNVTDILPGFAKFWNVRMAG